MLFDLRGKRKRAVQVTYVFLALLIGGGLVAGTFGASGNGGGLLSSIFGNGGSGGGPNDYDKQATRIELQLKRHPKDAALLLKLVRARILAGNTKSSSNSPTGQVTYSQDSLGEFNRATDAWERYLKTKPAKPDLSLSLLVANSYIALAQNERSLTLGIDDLKGAAKAQKIYADVKPSLGSQAQLALYDYLAGDQAGGDAARDAALKQATAANRSSLTARLKQARDQGIKLAKQVKLEAKLQGGKQQLQNPLGSLAGAGASTSSGLLSPTPGGLPGAPPGAPPPPGGPEQGALESGTQGR